MPGGRIPPAVAAEIGQPAQVGVGQDAQLNGDRDLPAHPGDEQIPLALEPVPGLPGRLRARRGSHMVRDLESGSHLSQPPLASLLRLYCQTRRRRASPHRANV